MITLNFSRIMLSAKVRDLHGVHALIWRAFADRTPKEDERLFLFRADRSRSDEHGPGWKVLVQSRVAPDWTQAKPGTLLHYVDTGPKLIDLIPNERLRFLLRANPTRSVKGRGEAKFTNLTSEEFRRARGHRVAIRAPEEALDWLREQGRRAGFGVSEAHIASERREEWSGSAGHATIDGIDFEGVLEVQDPRMVEEALLAGIGRGRGFGFGLLSVARDLNRLG